MRHHHCQSMVRLRKVLRLLVVVMTVGGGFTGLSAGLHLFFANSGQGSVSSILVILSLLLYAIILAGGVVFVYDPRRTTLVLIALAIQVPWVSSPVLGYRLAAGCHLTLGVVGGSISGGFLIGSDWQFSLLQASPWGAGVNVVALGFLLTVAMLFRCNKHQLPTPTNAPNRCRFQQFAIGSTGMHADVDPSNQADEG